MKKLLFLPFLILVLCFVSQQHITVYMVGDSTMQNYRDLDNPQRGWGQMFQQFFDTSVVKVENHAIGGRSSRSFLEEGRWTKVLEKLQKGDYVFIQFGHNDASKDKPERYTSPDDFKKNLVKYVTEAREKGAIPVLLTQTARRDFDSTGVYIQKKNDYVEATKAIAASSNVLLIDMNAESCKIVAALGKDNSKKMYMCYAPGEHPKFPEGKQDNTHLNEQGATQMASIAANGVRSLNMGLAKFLVK
jgi:lysophospholipase L1-like esterase